MSDQLDEQILAEVLEQALAEVKGNERWTNAFLRGAELLRTNPFLHLREDGTLLVLSGTCLSGNRKQLFV